MNTIVGKNSSKPGVFMRIRITNFTYSMLTGPDYPLIKVGKCLKAYEG